MQEAGSLEAIIEAGYHSEHSALSECRQYGTKAYTPNHYDLLPLMALPFLSSTQILDALPLLCVLIFNSQSP